MQSGIYGKTFDMLALDPDALLGPSAAQLETFREQGFLVIESVLAPDVVAALRARFDPLFRGEFETGTYPDEWHWREGVSLPDATRHMCNAWKSDLTVARLALSAAVGRFAAGLAGWDGIRLGQDTLWVKVPGAKPIALHQDSSFMTFLDPVASVTCWTTLDDTARDGGTLEYVPGSHRWPVVELPRDFHTPQGGYRERMRAVAARAGVAEPEIVTLEVPAGSMAFHAGEVWHGSGTNLREDLWRRSIGVHLLPGHARFRGAGGGYIYARYRRRGEHALDESHFPILWSREGARSDFIEGYLATGQIV